MAVSIGDAPIDPARGSRPPGGLQQHVESRRKDRQPFPIRSRLGLPASSTPATRPSPGAVRALRLRAADHVRPDGSWHGRQVIDGYFTIQQGDADSADVVAIQFGRPSAIFGEDGEQEPTSAADAVAILETNPDLEIVETDTSEVGGLEGGQITIENRRGPRRPDPEALRPSVTSASTSCDCHQGDCDQPGPAPLDRVLRHRPGPAVDHGRRLDGPVGRGAGDRGAGPRLDGDRAAVGSSRWPAPASGPAHPASESGILALPILPAGMTTKTTSAAIRAVTIPTTNVAAGGDRERGMDPVDDGGDQRLDERPSLRQAPARGSRPSRRRSSAG